MMEILPIQRWQIIKWSARIIAVILRLKTLFKNPNKNRQNLRK